MSAYHLAEWAAFQRVFGRITVQERIDWNLAALAAVLTGRKDVEPLIQWDNPPLPLERQFEAAKNVLASLIP